MVQEVRVVLDSCRATCFPFAPWKLTKTNVTFASACMYLGLGIDDKLELDVLGVREKKGIVSRVYADNPWLSTEVFPWKYYKERIEGKGGKYRYFDALPINTDEILEVATKDLENQDSGYAVIWLMDTHSPYYVDDKPYDWFVEHKDLINLYNRDEDTITDAEMLAMRRRQEEACYHVTQKVKKFLRDIGPNSHIVCADHGESFGENHRFGHGTDIHPVQFKIPWITQIEGTVEVEDIVQKRLKIMMQPRAKGEESSDERIDEEEMNF